MIFVYALCQTARIRSKYLYSVTGRLINRQTYRISPGVGSRINKSGLVRTLLQILWSITSYSGLLQTPEIVQIRLFSDCRHCRYQRMLLPLPWFGLFSILSRPPSMFFSSVHPWNVRRPISRRDIDILIDLVRTSINPVGASLSIQDQTATKSKTSQPIKLR